ncbi:MAG TPA: pyrroline-5-carboxylate reductase [Oligoflexia bacterium]|nr:pyrroline-5-carboxylate reductase [Oligoflexia bacterium]HMP27255.1 pyrroline-5-carboxylate reductase [Oligoflexia bacterium]
MSGDLIFGIIGGGKIGAAFARAWIASGFNPQSILVVEPDKIRAGELAKELGVKITALNQLETAKIILLSVKPQDFFGANWSFSEADSIQKKNHIYLSVMAGISIARLQETLDSERIVRCMPNLPVVAQAGLIAYYSQYPWNAEEQKLIKTVLKSGGLSLEVRSEELIDGITALSGSGPGFIYYLLERAQLVGEKMGFNQAELKLILGQTLKGATELWLSSDSFTLYSLKEAVASKGGTTAAGLAELEKSDVAQAIERALMAAYNRSRELGK